MLKVLPGFVLFRHYDGNDFWWRVIAMRHTTSKPKLLTQYSLLPTLLAQTRIFHGHGQLFAFHSYSKLLSPTAYIPVFCAKHIKELETNMQVNSVVERESLPCECGKISIHFQIHFKFACIFFDCIWCSQSLSE